MTYEEALNQFDSTNPFMLDSDKQEEYFNVIREALEKQIPKKPYLDNDNGIYEKEYGPSCKRSLFPNDPYCRCGQKLDWSEEK